MCSFERRIVNVAGSDRGQEKITHTMTRDNNDGNFKNVVFNGGKGKKIECFNEGVNKYESDSVNRVLCAISLHQARIRPISGGKFNSVISNAKMSFGTKQLTRPYVRQREIIEEREQALVERERKQDKGVSKYEDLMSNRAEDGETSEARFQFGNHSESEGDDYGDDYNSEKDNRGAVLFYQDKGGGRT
ncbi:hypothetical protein LguiA_029711 [Lonicera macranthoides]